MNSAKRPRANPKPGRARGLTELANEPIAAREANTRPFGARPPKPTRSRAAIVAKAKVHADRARKLAGETEIEGWRFGAELIDLRALTAAEHWPAVCEALGVSTDTAERWIVYAQRNPNGPKSKRETEHDDD